MRIAFRHRTRRLVLAYFVINALALLGFMAVGAYTLARSGSIPGWRGSPVEEVFWYGVGATAFTTAS